MLDKYIEELIDALMEAASQNMFPRGFTTSKDTISELKADIGFHVAVFLAYMHENPAIASPPYSDLEEEISSLVDFYMEAYLETVPPEEEPLTEEEILLKEEETLSQKEGFAVWIRALLTYANTASEGVFWPPYTYPRGTSSINRLQEFINGLASAFSSALIAAAFPSAFPASAQDTATLTTYYRIFVQTALTYAHNNPGIASPPY
jgi:hypothetical protein